MREYICIDIGGTAIKHGVIRESGVFAETGEMPTQAELSGGPGIMEKAKKIVAFYKEKYRPSGICVSTAGMVDCECGKIIHSGPSIPDYTGTEIKKELERFGAVPCEVENDVNCAGLAEAYAGAAKDAGISLCLTVGTGIGGAIIINKKVFRGFSGSACEVGYMHMPGGAFQDMGAGSTLVKKVAEYKGISAGDIDGKYVFERAAGGDEDCVRAIDEICSILGMGIANICYVLNPEVVVLGGGIMEQRKFLGERLRNSLERCLIPAVFSNTKLEFASNGNKAGMLGAFYHFQSRCEEKNVI